MVTKTIALEPFVKVNEVLQGLNQDAAGLQVCLGSTIRSRDLKSPDNLTKKAGFVLSTAVEPLEMMMLSRIL